MLSVVVSLAVTAVLTGGMMTPGPVSELCLKCICLTESGCKPIGCHPDPKKDSCGYFQIKEEYYEDCGHPGDGWKPCTLDYNCSSVCVENFMKRFVPHTKCPETCETYAREHGGGRKGCERNTTLWYWEKLKKIPGCEHLV